MNHLFRGNYFRVTGLFFQPAEGGVPDDQQYPGSSVFSVEPSKDLQRFEVSLLNNLLRVLIPVDQQACKIVSGV